MRVLVTGAAGFIGYSLCQRLLHRGDAVLGYDNLNDYYDVRLKQARLDRLIPQPGFQFRLAALEDQGAMEQAFADFKPDRVVNLAAQAGVGHSITHPRSYVSSNIAGFMNVLECCREAGTAHLVYASSSSVYGANTKLPFSVNDSVDHPLSMYAASKKCNELMAHTYSHLFGLPTTGLRFFTVYGPWGRPDMALFKFTRSILAGEPIDIYNFGRHTRDFTYIDDIIEGVVRVLDLTASADSAFDLRAPRPATSNVPYRVYNIGNQRSVRLFDYLALIEQALGRKAIVRMLPAQPGDVPDTLSDVSELQRDTGYAPSTPVQVGVHKFVEWYLEFHGGQHSVATTGVDQSLPAIAMHPLPLHVLPAKTNGGVQPRWGT